MHRQRVQELASNQAGLHTMPADSDQPRVQLERHQFGHDRGRLDSRRSSARLACLRLESRRVVDIDFGGQFGRAFRPQIVDQSTRQLLGAVVVIEQA